jgi:hypothetical protein
MRTALIGAVMSVLVGVASAGAQPVNVSVAPDGVTPGNGASGGATISASGRYVAFTSQATNLVAGDTNGSADVFVRDLQTNTTTRVSVATDGTQRSGDSGGFADHFEVTQVSISDDGNLVAFTSRAPLVNDDTHICTLEIGAVNCRDIYVHDRTLGSTTRISVASDGTQSDGESHDPHISGNGRYVVFTSEATNLVAGDHNGVRDVFLHDLLLHTTTRVSVAAGGVEGNDRSELARISADGSVIAFVSKATNLTDQPDSWTCISDPGVGCSRGYIVDRTAGTIERALLPTKTSYPATGSIGAVSLAASGRLVFTQIADSIETYLTVYDRVTHRASQVSAALGVTTFGVSDDGRMYGNGRWVYRFSQGGGVFYDRQTGLLTLSPPVDLSYPQFSGNGFRIVMSGQQPSDTAVNVYVLGLDSDGDGMTDAWEEAFQLNPADAGDAAQDSDGDGLSNLLEYQTGGHPKAGFKCYLAEGAANAFFSTRIALFNPNNFTASVVIRVMGANGIVNEQILWLYPYARTTYNIFDATTFNDPNAPTHLGGGAVGFLVPAPDNDFSTEIEASLRVVVDRTMYWDRVGYGSHAETAIESPGKTWYLAEGATHGAFDLFYLFQNPGAVDADVTVRYLRPAPQAPVIKTYVVPAASRRTIWVDQEGPELAATDVSAKIMADQPIIVERSMYYSRPDQPFAGGTDGAGLAAPAATWFLAEGATGSFFDLFVLIANAESLDAQVKVTYLLPDGTTIVKPHTIPANSRVTINVQGEDARLQDTPVSTIVETTNSVPVLVERSMWWPQGNWYEGHLSAGSTTTGTKWALAEGEFSQPDPLFPSLAGYDTDTYILIANTSTSAGTATVTLYYLGDTVLSVSRVVDLPPSSRVNIPVSVMFPEIKGHEFGTIVESNGVPIVVERAMYSNVPGVTWAAGTSALATKLQ